MKKCRNFNGFKEDREDYVKIVGVITISIISIVLFSVMAMLLFVTSLKGSESIILGAVAGVMSTGVMIITGIIILVFLESTFDVSIRPIKLMEELKYPKLRIRQYRKLNKYTQEEYLELINQRNNFNSKAAMFNIDMYIDENFNMQVPLELDMVKVEVPSCVQKLILVTDEHYDISLLTTIVLVGTDKSLLIIEHSWPCNFNALENIITMGREVHTTNESIDNMLIYIK